MMNKVCKKILKFVNKHKIIIAAAISLALFMGIIIMLSRKAHILPKMNNVEIVGNPVKNPNLVDGNGKANVNFDIVDNKKKSGKHQLQKSHANKCFSCEHELPFNEIYRSQKTKCFSCEQDLKDRIDSKSAFFGQPSKCFDCEAQLK